MVVITSYSIHYTKLYEAEMPSGVEVGLSDQVAKKLEEIVKNDKYTVKYSISAEAGSVVVNVDTPKKYERDVSIFEIA